MPEISIEMPWPSIALSPNGRAHWRDKHKATKASKNYAWGIAKSLMGPLGIVPGSWIGPISVQLTFHPSVTRDRDLDNMQASQKAALDGIALALGINDTHFRPVSFIGDHRKPACVVITLSPAAVSMPVRGSIS